MTAKRYILNHHGQVASEVLIEPTDPEGDFHIRTCQDIEPTLEYAKVKRDIGIDPKSFMRPVAEMPLTEYHRALQEGWGPEDFRKWCNKSENRPFRIWEGDV